MSEEQTELVVPGRFGVTNKQLIPVLKQAVGDQDVNKLILLKAKYLYTFDKSIRYLSKKERDFISEHVK
ncbi:hypothetical protein [Cohnella yongneupensis]|uniref:Uncharacterized protein n=1 Tax=Cohnella yongneupensis TaxID=425006 RepID=A0ABW0R2Q7_9BACL